MMKSVQPYRNAGSRVSPWCLAWAVVALCAVGPRAGQAADVNFSEDFSAFDPAQYMVAGTNVGPGTGPHAGAFVLTPYLGTDWEGIHENQTGRIFRDEWALIDEFVAEFDFRIGGSIHPAGGGDGMTFAFTDDYTYPAWWGGAHDYWFSGWERESEAVGWAVEIDTHYAWNAFDPPYQHIGLRTPDVEAGHIAVVEIDNPRDQDWADDVDVWHHVRIEFESGAVRVIYDHDPVLAATIPGFTPFEGYFGLTAATGGTGDWHIVDNFTVTESALAQVQIDIKPGSDINPINAGSEGVVPVAVFSSTGFDATAIDPSTVLLASAPVEQHPEGHWMMAEEHMNEDGLTDVIIHVRTQDLDPEELQTGYATLTGLTTGGLYFEGQDIVTIVPRDLPNAKLEVDDEGNPHLYGEHWAMEQIGACIAADIVKGYPDGLYRPDSDVTRDQMAVYIARALVAPSGEAGIEDYAPANPRDFPDAPPTGYGDDGTEPYWAYKHIECCVENGVIAGYEDGTYHPEYEVTRDQMAVYVARAMVAPTGEAALADYVPADPRDFPDVSDTGYGDDGTEPFWAYKHIEYCVEHGVVQGYDDGYYRPEIVVTRDQMAVYVARVFGVLD